MMASIAAVLLLLSAVLVVCEGLLPPSVSILRHSISLHAPRMVTEDLPFLLPGESKTKDVIQNYIDFAKEIEDIEIPIVLKRGAGSKLNSKVWEESVPLHSH